MELDEEDVGLYIFEKSPVYVKTSAVIIYLVSKKNIRNFNFRHCIPRGKKHHHQPSQKKKKNTLGTSVSAAAATTVAIHLNQL